VTCDILSVVILYITRLEDTLDSNIKGGVLELPPPLPPPWYSDTKIEFLYRSTRESFVPEVEPILESASFSLQTIP
jgi:hypothetical protein